LYSLLKSCAFNNSDIKDNLSHTKKEFFEDINLYTLEGVGKIDRSPQYPYIELEYVDDNERNIVYHGSKDMVYRREYKKLNNIWTTSFTSNGDTCAIITYEYILPNKLMNLYYCYNNNINDTVLTDVLVFEGSSETIYEMGNERNILPGINVIDFAKSNSKSVFTKDITIKDNILEVKEKRSSSGNIKSFQLL
jgi:hypothetical protein